MMKLTYLTVVASLTFASSYAEEQKLCPIMIEDEIDKEEIIEFEGKTIYMCCGGCIKAWNTNPIYYFKVARELKLIPQFETVSPELQSKLDAVELLPQRFCALRNDTLISPDSPSINYKGKKIYFYKERDIERKWNKDPEASFKAAREAGILPQFDS